MNIDETIDYLDSFPVWSPKAAADGTRPITLTAIRALMELLGNPQNRLKYVHVAGTNGKGSVCAYLSSILTAAGIRTGLFSSPYLTHVQEEMRINGEEIADEDLAHAATAVRAASERLKAEQGLEVSRFETECAIAFLYFTEKKCDLVILETGLGGRTDATNIIPVPELAVITTISLDHTEVLGPDLKSIAAQKAGIIKEGGTVLLYPKDPSVHRVFEEACLREHARYFDAAVPRLKSASLCGQMFDLEIPEEKVTFPSLAIRQIGPCQTGNASLAVQAACLLKEKGWDIPEEAVRVGLADAVWPGRFELMNRRPYVICDGSHNDEGVACLAEGLRRYFPGRKVHFVTGVMADKTWERMLGYVFPLAESFCTVTPENPRALPAVELAEYIRGNGMKARACFSVAEAVNAALDEAGEDGVVCVFGSLYYTGEARQAVERRKKRQDS